MKRVLITGVTGGLGAALVHAFHTEGWQVTATARPVHPPAHLPDVRYVAADLTEHPAGLCDGQQLVVHAAALSASWGPAQAFQATNVDATGALLRQAQQAGCRGFLFISSPSIYAAMRDRIGIREEDAPATPPLNCYAQSKLQAEKMVLAANGIGFATCAIRPRALVGPGDRVLLPRLAALARRKWIPMVRGGRAVIELTDMRDAATAILSAAGRLNSIGGEAINISGGQPISVKDLTLQLSQALGVRARTVPLPLWLAKAIANAAERNAGRAEPVLTPYTLATLAFSQTFNLAKAREKLGYHPRHDAVATLLEMARAQG